MDEVDELRERLADRNISFISRKTGIPYRTLLDFAKGRVKSTSVHNFKKLEKYFEASDKFDVAAKKFASKTKLLKRS